MLEYHAHVALLDQTRQTLRSLPVPNASAAAAMEAVDEELAAARLGACLDLLIGHASSDGSELELLTRASNLWQEGLALYEQIKTARLEFELSLLHLDRPNPVTVLQMGINRYYDAAQEAKRLIDSLTVLRAEIMSLSYLRVHPRQSDIPSPGWGWGDAFLGRRTFAFVEALHQGAANVRMRALAMGSVAGFAANVAGSAYLGHVVGGPRRLHRFRDRLARNTLGAWMRARTGTPDTGWLARDLSFDQNPEEADLPSDLGQHIAAALAVAFPMRQPPDLALGYRRMLRHLELLSGFRMPGPPEPPPMVMDAAKEGAIGTATFGTPGVDDTGLVGSAPDPQVGGPDPGPSSGKSSVGDLCLAGLLTLGVAFVVYGIWCIDRLARDKKCGVEDFLGDANPPPDPRDPPVTQQELEVMRKPDQAAHLLQDTFEVQMRLWQAFEAAKSFLVVTGLVYPEEERLETPLHAQFLRPQSHSPWPLREEANAEESYYRYPVSAVEAPAQPSPFPAGRGPEWLLHSDPVDNAFAVAEIAIGAFMDLYSNEERRLGNLDLDADRGHGHRCWRVAPGTSIKNPVLSVDYLIYDME